MSRTFLVLSLLLLATELERRATAADEAAGPRAHTVAQVAPTPSTPASPLGR
jgi:hypothetical protein